MKPKLIGIYKITSPVGKVYIGQSIDIYKRWGDYQQLHCIGQRKLYFSLKKYGVESHVFDIITTCNENQLCELERYYQEVYSCTGRGGLNLILTGTDELPYRHSEETIALIRTIKQNCPMPPTFQEKGHEALRGKHLSDEHKMKLSVAGKKRDPAVYKMAADKRRGVPRSVETKKKIGDGNRGLIRTDETRRKLSESHKGHIVPLDVREKAIESQGRLILDFNTGVYYRSFRELCRISGKSGHYWTRRLLGRIQNTTGHEYV